MHKRLVENNRGFTIVELLVVIVVIGILAAITIIAFNGVSRSATNSVLTSNLAAAAKSIEVFKNGDTTSLYPLTLADAKFSSDNANGIIYTYNVSSDRTLYCLQAVVNSRTYFYASTSSKAEPGICEGTTGVPGDGSSTGVVAPTTAELIANGDGGGLRVVVNAAWTELSVSWNAVPNAQRYEVQVDKGNGSWLYVNKTDGSVNGIGTQACAVRQTGQYSEYCSAQISSSNTSVAWQHSHVFPSNTTNIFKYRTRAIVGNVEQQWYTATLNLTPSAQLTKVKNFKVLQYSASDATKYVLSWDSAAVNNVPKPKIQIQINKNNAGWIMVATADGAVYGTGSQPCATNESAQYSEYCSAQIDPATTTLTWSHINSRPSNATNVYEYRIRLRSNNLTGLYGDWTTYTAQIPAVNSLNTPTGFTVTPLSGWTGVSLGWTNAAAMNTPNPKIQIQVNRNGAGWNMVNQTTGAVYGTGSQPCATNESAQYSEYCSAQIDPATTSLSWTHTNVIPPAGQTYEYRIRYRSESLTGLYTNWTTVSLAR